MSIIKGLIKTSVPLWMLIGIASAAIIGVTLLVLFIGGYGTYQPPQDLGYSVFDADPTDEIDFEYTPHNQVISFNFPVWANRTHVEYRDVIGFIPNTDGYMELYEIQIAPGNIQEMRVQMHNASQGYTYPWGVPEFPFHITLNRSVAAGQQYNFSFMITTGNDTSLPEMVTFEVIKK